jgi:archaellum biogenesis protein FlaJ (TadC family)
MQYLVKWKGFPSEENTWEPSTMMKEDVPALIKHYHNQFPEAIQAVQPSKLLVKRLSEFVKIPT